MQIVPLNLYLTQLHHNITLAFGSESPSRKDAGGFFPNFRTAVFIHYVIIRVARAADERLHPGSLFLFRFAQLLV